MPQINIHRANERGYHDYGWLKSRHSFSFNDYFNPVREDFGVLRVLNDEVIQPDSYFSMHQQKNLEVVLIPLKGKLLYKTPDGQSTTLENDEAMVISTGTGINHSFGNGSKHEILELLQLWIYPKIKDIEPRKQVLLFPASERKNKLDIIVKPDLISDILYINQDIWISRIELSADNTLDYKLRYIGNIVMVFVIEGSILINSSGEIAGSRDSVEITGADDNVSIMATAPSDLLIIESVAD